VFELNAYLLERFASYIASKKTDFILPFQFSEHSGGLHVALRGFVRRAPWQTQNPAGGASVRACFVVERLTGHEKGFLFLGQPAGYALRKHILMLIAECGTAS
jgi:hypothetical protein